MSTKREVARKKRLKDSERSINGYLPQMRFSPDRKKIFLREFSERGQAGLIIKEMQLSRSTLSRALETDPDFKEAYDIARLEFGESIAVELHRRAVQGIDEPVFYKGNIVGYRRVFSDTLLLAHARAHLDEYKQQVDINTKVTGGVLVVHKSADTPEDWASKHTIDITPETKDDDTGTSVPS